MPSIERVLVVEDSMIIALDTEETLVGMGVSQVEIAGSVDGALSVIEQEAPQFALLDYNLGDETSEPIAAQLEALGIPFYFVTGYGDAVSRLSASQALGVLQKPYSPADLKRLLLVAEEHVRG